LGRTCPGFLGVFNNDALMLLRLLDVCLRLFGGFVALYLLHWGSFLLVACTCDVLVTYGDEVLWCFMCIVQPMLACMPLGD
jgi:hypothetical protein